MSNLVNGDVQEHQEGHLAVADEPEVAPQADQEQGTDPLPQVESALDVLGERDGIGDQIHGCRIGAGPGRGKVRLVKPS